MVAAGTGQPIIGAFVSVEMGPLFNGTNTDGTGFYAINVPAGTFRLAASALGYARTERVVPITDGETRWENFTLIPTTATVRGLKARSSRFWRSVAGSES